MSDYNNYGLGKVSNSGDEFIEAWKTSKDDIISEIMTADSFDSDHFHMEGMVKFTRLMTMIKKFEELTLDMCKCMDAQIKEIRDLKQEIKEIRELKHETKVIQNSIYKLTNKVEEVIEKDEDKVTDSKKK